MRAAIIQSNYLPWKGYFDIIDEVDLFAFYDDRQFTKNDWRNRNRIKTAHGLEWLSIPVGQRQDRLICEVTIPSGDWAQRHFARLEAAYGEAPHWAHFLPFLEEVYLRRKWTTLSELNHFLIRTIAREFLGIRTEIVDSREFRLEGDRQARLLDLLRQMGATEYLSGPAARAYIDPTRFEEAGIRLAWKDYSGYPEYPQFHPPFRHDVTVLDLLFHTGTAAPEFIWGARTQHAVAAVAGRG